MKRLLIVTSMTLMLVGIAVSAAFGQTGIVIPLDTVVRAAPGSLTVLAVVDTPSDLVGSTCQGLGVTQNQDSVHPNNDIIMESGATVAVFEDVEETPDKVTTASGPVTLGDTVTLTLRMGSDGVFSGGMAVFVDVDCLAPPTTTTTTLPETPVKPEIEIVKTADPEFYGDDGIGHFSIAVTNPGPVDLTNVRVTDDDALAIDPNSNCPREVGDLAVGEEVEYECTISGLDGVSPYPNEAIAIGIGPDGTEVTDSSRAIVFPAVQDTTVTTTTQATIETLPVTGLASDQTRDLTLAGLALVVSGMLILGGLVLSGRYRQDL